MIVLPIVGGILLLLFIVLFLPASLSIVCGTNDEFDLKLKLGVIRIYRLPKKSHLSKRHYAKKTLLKRQKKQQKKQTEKAEKKSTSSKKENKIQWTLSFILCLLQIALDRLGHHLHVKTAKCRIIVATGDPAETALLFPVVCHSADAIMTFLDEHTNVKYPTKKDIYVDTDFVGTHPMADIHFSIRLRIYQALDIIIRLFIAFLKEKKTNSHM